MCRTRGREQATTYHTITAKTERQAQMRRDELIRELEDKGAAVTSKMTFTVEQLEAMLEEARGNPAPSK